MWQFVHWNVLTMSSWRRPAGRGAVGLEERVRRALLLLAEPLLEVVGVFAITRKRMLACERPQYSAHCPR